MYSNNDDIIIEKHNKAITLLKMITNLVIIKSFLKCTNWVTALLIKDPKYHDSTENWFCASNTRPMYQDIKTKNCQLSNIEAPDLEIAKIKPIQETRKSPELEISEDRPSEITEIPIVQQTNDETSTKKSIKTPKSLDTHICNRVILVESPMFRRKSLWITPTPSSVYKEHYKSIPKIMNIKY